MSLSNEGNDDLEAASMRRSPLFWCAFASVLLTRLCSIPRSFWEFDETLFAQAILSYDPLNHHPPPPGYPVFIALGKLINFFVHDPFVALVMLSVIGSLAGFCFLTAAFRNLSGDVSVGIVGALFFYLSPVMLVHSTLPISDAIALCLLASTLWAASLVDQRGGRGLLLFPLMAALTVGCRPQFSIAIVPLLLYVAASKRDLRRALVILSAFAVVCLFWMVPLIAVTGGLQGFLRFEGTQANYFATHDADISRSGRSAALIVLRFIAHPWGPKWLSAPLLILSLLGITMLMVRRQYRALPLMFACLPYLVFSLLMMDPADGPRYALPALLGMAYTMAVGLTHAGRVMGRSVGVVAVCLFGVASLTYTSTFIAQRSSESSPPERAAAFARATLPSNAVILAELPLWPHATYLLNQFQIRKIEEGWKEFAGRSDIPLFIYADGFSQSPGAKNFSWIDSDAYGKLTRNHYRVSSLIPLPPSQRFVAAGGVFPPERTTSGLSWRWLGRQAQIRLPDVDATRVVITLTLPPAYPAESNEIDLFINGRKAPTLHVPRNASRDITLPVVDGENVVTFRPRIAYAPAQISESENRDPRTLSVQLTAVRQLR